MARRLAKQNRPSGAKRALRIFYGTLVVLSALIVGAFAAYQILVKPPAQAPVTATKPSLTDNPDTLEDERLAVDGPVGPERQEYVYTFLLAAKDVDSSNADTIMVVKYDVPNKTVGVVSILRDTMTEEYAKINASYHDGPENLRRVVSDLLGIPIDFYITVDIKAFKALVNAVDGIDFYVPINMSYDDPTQNLSIHYTKGTHHLNGQQAMEVARFRTNNNKSTGYNDTGRTETQRNMLAAIAKKVFSPAGLLKLGEYIEIFYEYVKTDLTANDIAYFTGNAKDVDLESSVSMVSLPGESYADRYYKGNSWCLQLDQEESLAIINSHLNPYTTPVTMDMVNFIQAW